MATNNKTIIPAVATHPGTVLKKELKARGLKQKDFAATIDMPAPNLSELITGKRNITEAIAIKLQEALGIPFQNWMNLQNRYYYVTKRREEMDADESAEMTKGHKLVLRMPSELHSRIARAAAAAGTTINDFINKAVSAEVSRFVK